MLESDCSAPSKESFMSPPSVDASSDSSNPDDWKSVNGSAGSKLGSRQPSCTVDKFSSYHSSVVFDEHAADAAWRDFMSWRFKWMEVRTALRNQDTAHGATTATIRHNCYNACVLL
jgi:hypothetical protein